MIRQFSVTKTPVQLLDQVPAGSTIINTSSTDVVWCAANPGVFTGNGFPIQPLASMTKPDVGPLWAVLDSSSLNTSTLILLGDDLAGYSDPVALAAAVAAELAITGVPNVLRETVIADTVAIPASSALTFEVGQYATINVGFTSGVSGAYQFITEAPANIVQNSGLLIQTGLITHISVQGSRFRVFNLDAFTAHVNIVGTNRSALGLYDVRDGGAPIVRNDSIVGVVVGQNNFIGFSADPASMQGICTIRFSANAAVTSGSWKLLAPDGSSMSICETQELLAGSSSPKVLVKTLSVPPGASYAYNCTGVAGGTVGISIMQGQLS